MSGALEGIYEPGVVDPGFPVSNSTKSFWQSSKHPRANHQSTWPTEPVDIAIIGSGISGMSLARTLLSKRPDLRITLLDARDLCSGATARNGGHIKTMTFLMWEERKQQFGIEEAVRISAFEHSHLEAMAVAIKEDGVECDLVSTEGVEAYFDKKLFDQAVAALEDMRAHAPHLAAKHKIYTDKDHLQQAMKLSPRCIGAITVPAASVWPYKWVTRVWNDLIDQTKLNIQTHTTVREIIDRDGDEFAIVKTDRGDIKARKVVHATNAWLGHLLPELRPFISPVRGNVVHYGPTKGRNSALGLDSGYSLWLRYGKKDYDYLIQRKDGGIVVGRANTGRTTTGDDSETDLSPMAHLRGFGQEVAARPVSGPSSHIDHAWSGILAFSQDGLPFAGKLSTPDRSHQWVCGGYHATGMIKAFRTSQAVAQMLLGEDVDEDFPRSMLVTEERLRELGKSLDRGNAPNFRARARL